MSDQDQDMNAGYYTNRGRELAAEPIQLRPETACQVCGEDLVKVDRVRVQLEDYPEFFLCLKHAAEVQDLLADQGVRVDPVTGAARMDHGPGTESEE